MGAKWKNDKSNPNFSTFLWVVENVIIVTAGPNKETLLRTQKCVQDAKNDFGKFQKHFLLPRRRFCVFNIRCLGKQPRNHLGNTEEILILNVFRMFPRLRTQVTYLEDAEFASRKQKCFASFRSAHPYNIVSNIDSEYFCSNVSSFAQTFYILHIRFDQDIIRSKIH